MPLQFSKTEGDALLRPRASRPKRMNSRARAEYNATRTLEAVAKYSHLRCAEIAAAVFPHARFGLQMSQRVTRKLVASGELARRANALGSISYVLTRSGAAHLELRGIPAQHGLDISSVSGGTCRHSILCARYCIAQEAAGFRAYHEATVLQGNAPFSKTQLLESTGKLPDALITKGSDVWLVEVESAIKSLDLHSKALASAVRVGRRLHPDVGLVLQGIIFVFDASLAHASRIARAARARWAERSESERKALAQRITLCRVSLGLPLVWLGCSTEPLRL